MLKERIFRKIEELEPRIIETLCDLIELPSVTPINGGDGEVGKAEYLIKLAQELEFEHVERYDAKDLAGNIRPNVVVMLPGKSAKKIWITSHMDVVPAGDLSLWETPPFKASIRGTRIIGRGVNDNLKALVASFYSIVALKELDIKPEHTICLAFVSDEETGSIFGIDFLIREKKIFTQEDLVVVPDMGSIDGALIEVAEKSTLWIEFCVKGAQVHASMPHRGLNACRVANKLSVELDHALHNAFPEEDALFSPSFSTFEPTKREGNVPNVNTIPGVDVFYYDCRILPKVKLDEIVSVVKATCDRVAASSGASILPTVIQWNETTDPTAIETPVYRLLQAAVKSVLGVETRPIGVGVGTCAVFFRRAGIPAVVWGQEHNVAHMPNEYVEKEHVLNEAKVFALMMISKSDDFPVHIE